MNIVVVATALQSGGALTIYKQFLNHLKNNICDSNYYVFVDESMPKPDIQGVNYIISSTHSGIRRVLFDAFGCKKYFRERGIKIDVVVSLQNTPINAESGCRSIVYYHQSLPLYPYKWNIFKKSERLLFFYKNIYPFFVRLFLNKNCKVVVQTNFIKQEFVRKFRHPAGNVHVLFPDTEKITIADIEPVNLDQSYFHFIYPASTVGYKNHIVLCRALNCIKKINKDLYRRIKVHFTIKEENCPEFLKSEIIKTGLLDSVVFDGVMPHDELLRYYKSSQCLLFPSYLETLGLPLLEAASFGLPVLTVDLPYAREVMQNYEGAFYVQYNDEIKWAEAMINIANDYKKFTPLEYNPNSSWEQFFELLKR